jgi:hypothetical protein
MPPRRSRSLHEEAVPVRDAGDDQPGVLVVEDMAE